MLIFSHFSTTNQQDMHNKKWCAIKQCGKAEEMHDKLESKKKQQQNPQHQNMYMIIIPPCYLLQPSYSLFKIDTSNKKLSLNN